MSFEPQSQSFGESTASILAAESARAFMQRVYWWMSLGLGLTGATAWYVARDQQLFMTLAPYSNVLAIVGLVVVVLFRSLSHRVGGTLAAAMFLAYSLINGVVFSTLFMVFTAGSIASTFFISAATFGALSVYGTVTKRNLSAWGSFLFIGLIGVIVASVVNIFLHSGMLTFVVSCAGVVVFAGLTAYDTQKLRTMHASSGYSSSQALAITGALTLYLDFINLFLMLLQLFGRRR